MTRRGNRDRDVNLRIGHEELVLRGRYEVLSILNDVLIAVFFIIGSILFFQESTATAGTWLFLLGSIELLLRPVIRLARRFHLHGIGSHGDTAASQDY